MLLRQLFCNLETEVGFYFVNVEVWAQCHAVDVYQLQQFLFFGGGGDGGFGTLEWYEELERSVEEAQGLATRVTEAAREIIAEIGYCGLRGVSGCRHMSVFLAKAEKQQKRN